MINALAWQNQQVIILLLDTSNFRSTLQRKKRWKRVQDQDNYCSMWPSHSRTQWWNLHDIMNTWYCTDHWKRRYSVGSSVYKTPLLENNHLFTQINHSEDGLEINRVSMIQHALNVLINRDTMHKGMDNSLLNHRHHPEIHSITQTTHKIQYLCIVHMTCW